MPYEYVWYPPSVAARYGGRRIWHTYKDGDNRAQHWFTTDIEQDDLDNYWENTYIFDIRDIELPDEIRQLPQEDQLKYIIKHRLVKWPEDKE